MGVRNCCRTIWGLGAPESAPSRSNCQLAEATIVNVCPVAERALVLVGCSTTYLKRLSCQTCEDRWTGLHGDGGTAWACMGQHGQGEPVTQPILNAPRVLPGFGRLSRSKKQGSLQPLTVSYITPAHYSTCRNWPAHKHTLRYTPHRTLQGCAWHLARRAQLVAEPRPSPQAQSTGPVPALQGPSLRPPALYDIRIILTGM